MLNQEYRPVASDASKGMAPANVQIHALFDNAGETLCGELDSIDSRIMLGCYVDCPKCTAGLKKIRQQRSRDGTARGQERRAAERKAEEDKPPNRYAQYGKDYQTARDQNLIDAMRLRAFELADNDENALSAIIANAATRLQEHVNSKPITQETPE